MKLNSRKKTFSYTATQKKNTTYCNIYKTDSQLVCFCSVEAATAVCISHNSGTTNSK